MATIILPTCPNCGCHDIRCEMWVGYKCFKCGRVFEEEKLPAIYSGNEDDDIDKREYKVSEKTCGA